MHSNQDLPQDLNDTANSADITAGESKPRALPSPFDLMITVFIGLVLSLLYGSLGAIIIYYYEGQSASLSFLMHYNLSFRALISFGLILGSAFVVYRSQNIIPETIEKSFDIKNLREQTDYCVYRNRFKCRRRSASFAIEFFFVGLFIFVACGFPGTRPEKILMIVSACAQYALGVYVGRKLCYAGMMLHSLLTAKVTRNLFKDRELDEINSYVHIVSTLTIIFVYINVIGYYEGPFEYRTVFGESVKIFLLLPALIAAPVLLIFNFYPRIVLRKLYSQSIDLEVKDLQEDLQDERLSFFEKESYLIEFNKMYREELRYSLQLTLGDLPIGITILIMVLQPLLDK